MVAANRLRVTAEKSGFSADDAEGKDTQAIMRRLRSCRDLEAVHAILSQHLQRVPPEPEDSIFVGREAEVLEVLQELMATLRTNDFYAGRRIPRDQVHASPWQGGPGIGKTRLGEEITKGGVGLLAGLLLEHRDLLAALKNLKINIDVRELEDVVRLLDSGRISYAYMEFNSTGGEFTLADCTNGRFDAKAADRAIGLRLYASLFFNLTAVELRTVITTKRLKQLFTIKNVCRLRAKLVREQGGFPEQSVLASIIVMDEIQLAASKLERLCKIDAQTALKTILKAVCDYKSLYSGKDFHALMFIPMGTNLHKVQRAFELTEYGAAKMHDLLELRDDGELPAAFVESVMLSKHPSEADKIFEFVYSGPVSLLLAKAGGVPRYLMAVARAAVRPAFWERLPEVAAPGIYAKLAAIMEPYVEEEVEIWFRGSDLIERWGGVEVAKVLVSMVLVAYPVEQTTMLVGRDPERKLEQILELTMPYLTEAAKAKRRLLIHKKVKEVKEGAKDRLGTRQVLEEQSVQRLTMPYYLLQLVIRELKRLGQLDSVPGLSLLWDLGCGGALDGTRLEEMVSAREAVLSWLVLELERLYTGAASAPESVRKRLRDLYPTAIAAESTLNEEVEVRLLSVFQYMRDPLIDNAYTWQVPADGLVEVKPYERNQPLSRSYLDLNLVFRMDPYASGKDCTAADLHVTRVLGETGEASLNIFSCKRTGGKNAVKTVLQQHTNISKGAKAPNLRVFYITTSRLDRKKEAEEAIKNCKPPMIVVDGDAMEGFLGCFGDIRPLAGENEAILKARRLSRARGANVNRQQVGTSADDSLEQPQPEMTPEEFEAYLSETTRLLLNKGVLMTPERRAAIAADLEKILLDGPSKSIYGERLRDGQPKSEE